ncbi:MAG: adenylate/guanylate cyclase domain-containing protein [Clostridia bacterium]
MYRYHAKKSDGKLLRHLIIAFAVSVIVTIVSITGVLRALNLYMLDHLYQTSDGYSEEVLVIGIDSYSLSQLGEWPWSRDIMADVINTLNADEENRPAAIGVDVLYITDGDPELDAYLAEAASADNVVVAGGVEFGTTMLFDEDDQAYIENFNIVAYNMPFSTLRESAEYGHINAMYDNDGVLRHHLWSVTDENGEEVLSLPYKIYLKYCENQGIEPSFSPSLSKLGFWWVDYTAKVGSFYSCSIVDIVNGEYDPTIFKDAIVLIGPYDSSLYDEYTTPVDRAQNMYGVEYLANVTNAMLLNETKVEVSNNLRNLAIFCATFICTMIVLAFSIKISLLVAIVLACCTLFCNVTAYRIFDLVFLPLIPLLGMIVAWIGSVINNYIVAKSEQTKVAQTFGKYVDPEVMKELLKTGEEPLGLGGKTVDVAVLFVDIRGFTTISEKLDPEEVVEILNQFLTLTSECIKRNQGTLDKFVGDCTMAFWGAPLECENPIYLACRAAMDMVTAATPLEQYFCEKYGEKVAFGIGVHYGKAIVGNIGATDRMDYTAIGDTVNTAARLESVAPAGKVYISRAVADGLGEMAIVEPLDHEIILKGKEEGFEVLTLERFKETFDL